MPRGYNIIDEAQLQGRLWSPAQMQTALWLDASDISTISVDTGVSQWRDKSGNNSHATQSVSSSRPTYDATGFNGLPCVTFGATVANVMVTPTLPLTSSGAVIFYGFRLNNDIGYGVVANSTTHWDRFDDGKSYPSLLRATRIENLALSAPLTGNHIMCYIANPASEYTIRRDGAQIYSAGAFTFSNNIAGIGAGHGAPLTVSTAGGLLRGSIVEVVIVPSTMSLGEIQKVEGYLSNKWGIQIPATHPYANRPPLIGDN